MKHKRCTILDDDKVTYAGGSESYFWAGYEGKPLSINATADQQAEYDAGRKDRQREKGDE